MKNSNITPVVFGAGGESQNIVVWGRSEDGSEDLSLLSARQYCERGQ